MPRFFTSEGSEFPVGTRLLSDSAVARVEVELSLRGGGFEKLTAGVVSEDFAAQGPVVFSAGRLAGVLEDGLAEAGGFSEADVAANASFEKADGAPGAAT